MKAEFGFRSVGSLALPTCSDPGNLPENRGCALCVFRPPYTPMLRGRFNAAREHENESRVGG
jgi:hypothetical protein